MKLIDDIREALDQEDPAGLEYRITELLNKWEQDNIAVEINIKQVVTRCRALNIKCFQDDAREILKSFEKDFSVGDHVNVGLVDIYIRAHFKEKQ